MSHLRTLAAGMGVCIAIALIACGNGNPNQSTGTGTGTCNGKAKVSGLGTVGMTIQATDNLVFVPASSAASVGQVVEFKNTGSVPHTVTFQDNNDSCLTDDSLNPGATWDVMFSAPGKYNYLCTIHAPNMKGEITVSGSAAAPTTSAAAAGSGPSPSASPTPGASATPSPAK